MEDTTSTSNNRPSNSIEADATSRKVEVLLDRFTTRDNIPSVSKHLDKSGSWVIGTDLHILVDPSHGRDSNNLLALLKDVVTKIPFIRSIQICCHEPRPGLQPVRMRLASWPLWLLTRLLSMLSSNDDHQVNLVSVKVCRLKLVGSWNDFKNFSLEVRNLATVQGFYLDKVRLEDVVPPSRVPNGAPPGCCWLDPVIESVSTLPCLENLRILGESDFGEMNTVTKGDLNSVSVMQQTLRNLCASPSLRSLCLIHFNLSDDNVAQMVQQLETNKALRELDIDCNLGNESTRSLVSLMENNKKLESLNLCVRNPRDGNNNNNNADILQMEDNVNLQLADGVRKSCLVNFALFRKRLSPRSQKAFRDTIRKQYCLEKLTFFTVDEDINQSLREDEVIAFYLKLNKCGRRQILNGIPADKSRLLPPPAKASTVELCVVDTLLRVIDDLSCLFYVLREKPCICQRALQTRAITTTRAKAQCGKRKRMYRPAK